MYHVLWVDAEGWDEAEDEAVSGGRCLARAATAREAVTLASLYGPVMEYEHPGGSVVVTDAGGNRIDPYLCAARECG